MPRTEQQFEQLGRLDRRPAGGEGRRGESRGCWLGRGWQADRQPAAVERYERMFFFFDPGEKKVT